MNVENADTVEKMKLYFRFNLKRIMRQKGIKQKELGMMTGISESSICKYMKGERLPSIAHLIDICKALDCEIETLLYFEKN